MSVPETGVPEKVNLLLTVSRLTTIGDEVTPERRVVGVHMHTRTPRVRTQRSQARGLKRSVHKWRDGDTHTGEQASARKRVWVLTVCERQIASSDHHPTREAKIFGIKHLQLVTTEGRVWRKAHFKFVWVLCARPRVSAPHGRIAPTPQNQKAVGHLNPL